MADGSELIPPAAAAAPTGTAPTRPTLALPLSRQLTGRMLARWLPASCRIACTFRSPMLPAPPAPPHPPCPTRARAHTGRLSRVPSHPAPPEVQVLTAASTPPFTTHRPTTQRPASPCRAHYDALHSSGGGAARGTSACSLACTRVPNGGERGGQRAECGDGQRIGGGGERWEGGGAPRGGPSELGGEGGPMGKEDSPNEGPYSPPYPRRRCAPLFTAAGRIAKAEE